MSRILVTGGGGFVGQVLIRVLTDSGCQVRAAVRDSSRVITADQVVVGNIDGATEWSHALEGIDTVIHLAARVHVLRDTPDHDRAYFQVNTEGTRQLARQAAASGVERFVYLSSIKVNGERTFGTAFRPEDPVNPIGPYAISKHHAEVSLTEVSSRGTMRLAIVRPPLIYGPHVRANFLRLLHWVHRGLPLPFGRVRNRRSLVSVWNVCDLLRQLAGCSAEGVFMVSDGTDLSTPELIRILASSMGQGANLIDIPEAWLKALARCGGKQEELERLCGSLVVDIARTRREVDWEPALSAHESLARTAAWFLAERNRAD
jgi:UDP-glucose 4-epimerase